MFIMKNKKSERTRGIKQPNPKLIKTLTEKEKEKLFGNI